MELALGWILYMLLVAAALKSGDARLVAFGKGAAYAAALLTLVLIYILANRSRGNDEF